MQILKRTYYLLAFAWAALVIWSMPSEPEAGMWWMALLPLAVPWLLQWPLRFILTGSPIRKQ